MRPSRPLALAAAAALLATACDRGRTAAADRPALAPTRGVVLITLGSVGARHLGAYGAGPRVSPFFDRLAARGALFDTAIAQSPSTLISNVSLATGLYPRQHGVEAPATALSPRLATLPERFATFGYRTAGFTGGGFVSRHYGFHRGFDHFDDRPVHDDEDVERTFGAAVEFLGRLGPADRFYLYVHAASAGAPYDPPPAYRQRFAAEAPAPPGPAAATGADLRAVDRGFLAVDAAAAERLAALYDGGIAYLDRVLESFFGDLERLGLGGSTTIVLTADHGQEFLEHGRLGSFQVYPETVRVPLLVLHPGLAGGRRIAELAQLVDVAPTLYELAGLPPAAAVGGRSLVPLLTGDRRTPTWAYAEAAGGRRQRTLLRRHDGATRQLVTTAVPAERDGTWITRAAGLELPADAALSVVSFHRERDLRLRLNGDDLGRVTIGTGWAPLDLELPPGAPRYRLDVAADGCDSPRALGVSDDPRCLSFKLRGAPVRLVELFALDEDPAAARDVAAQDLALRDRLAARLAELEWSVVEPPVARPPTADTAELLRSLGYLEPSGR